MHVGHKKLFIPLRNKMLPHPGAKIAVMQGRGLYNLSPALKVQTSNILNKLRKMLPFLIKRM